MCSPTVYDMTRLTLPPLNSQVRNCKEAPQMASPEILPCLDHGMVGSAEWHRAEEQKASCLGSLEGNKPRWCDHPWLPQLA